MVKHSDGKIQRLLVIGLGRIGLPQALTFAHFGITVYGFDRNTETAEAFMRGKTPFYEPEMDEYLQRSIQKTFFPFSSWDQLKPHLTEIDAIIFTVGTHALNAQEVLKDDPFDLSAYFELLDILFSPDIMLKKGIKLIVRTTLPLGGTDRLKQYLESTHALKEGHDFFLAFVPERMTEGMAISELTTLPKVVGVYSETAFEPIKHLFEQGPGKVIRVRNPITAEFCKLTDNSFRSTIFSYANELAMHASEFDIHVDEVIQAVNHHYERNHIPQPGFVSGYCLTKDPYLFELGFLNQKKDRDFHSVWYYGRKTNDYLIDFVVSKVINHVKKINNPCVAILGLSFKSDIDDFRMSHAFKIIDKLIASGVTRFKVYDPHLDSNKYTKLPDAILPYITQKSTQMNADFLTDTQAIILCDQPKALHDLHQRKTLSQLFEKVVPPCYLFDGWNIWTEAQYLNQIHYEGMGFREKQ